MEGVAGVIENGATARKVIEAPNSMTLLGLTTDEKAMYVVDRGGDPAFVAVRVVQLANGQTLARLPYEGYGLAVLSPGRTKIVTVGQPNDHIDTLIFYDVTNQTGGPRNVTLPRAGWSIGQVIWGGDDLSVYALAGPVASQPKQELWRVDPATKRSELVAKDLPTDTRLISVSNDGRWLVAQYQQSTMVIDLTNGRTKGGLLPQVVVIAH
jgi:hypothetical protein